MAIPRSALVADDENHIRAYVRIILSRLGVDEVYEARTGEEALEIHIRERPDIVLLDINMPGKTGLEVLPEILKVDPEAVVVMLTGHASRHLVEQSAKAGAIQYIRKDTPQEEISRMLNELFEELYGESEL
jgi:two-component system chemotaxis response regulator CheY